MSSSGIYTITCKINNKVYVGSTIHLNKREYDHVLNLRNNVHANRYLQNSWNKYGEENFKYEILEECDIEFLLSQENYWCNMLNSHNKKYGYNIQPIDPHGRKIHTAETIAKISKSLTGKPANHSIEFIERLRKRFQTAIWTEEQKEKGIAKRRKEIICLSLNGKFFKSFKSAREASLFLSIDYKLISLNCRKKCNTAKGYIFILKKDYDETKDYSIYKTGKRPVIMYDVNMNYVKEFITMTDAGRQFNTSDFPIRYAIKYDKLFNNYRWKYKN